MKLRILVGIVGLGLALGAHADSRGGVYVYKAGDHGYYGAGSQARSYQYDPRSPYPQHPQYQRNLPNQPGYRPPQTGSRTDIRLGRWQRNDQRFDQRHPHYRPPHHGYRPPQHGYRPPQYQHQPRGYYGQPQRQYNGSYRRW